MTERKQRSEVEQEFEKLLAFVDARLEKVHTPDPELVKKHNVDPLNKDWQIPEDAPWEQSDVVHDILAFLAERMIELNREKQAKIREFLEWLEVELKVKPDKKGNTGIDALTGKTKLRNYLGDYQKGEEALSFDEFWAILRKNKNRIERNLSPSFMQEVKRAYEESLSGLLPIKERLRLTDGLIDQIVYRLYGLTEEEVRIVEERG
jgi:hypothetical protein